MENEIWKPINGYEGLYEVSNLGNVRSLGRTIICGSKMLKLTGKTMKLGRTKYGYLQCGLSKNGEQKRYYVHRLVWEAFNGPVPDGLQINHISEEKTENRLENLNLMTPKENSNWGTKTKRIIEKRSKKIYQYDGDELVGIWQNAEIAANFLGIQRRHICSCCNGKRKTCGGYKWSYKKAV